MGIRAKDIHATNQEEKRKERTLSRVSKLNRSSAPGEDPGWYILEQNILYDTTITHPEKKKATNQEIYLFL